MSDPSASSSPVAESSGKPEGEHRRSFLASLAALVTSALALLVPVGVGVNALLAPLRRRPGREQDRFVPVAPLEQVPDDGVPRRFLVRRDTWNQWTFRPQVPVGSVYLIRRQGQEVPVALNARCPHAGCTVGLAGGADREAGFLCPCHKARFRPDGKVITPSPSPRDLDPLECRVEKGVVLVRFRNFVVGIEERIPES